MAEPTGDHADKVTEETREMADGARRRAARAPSAEEIASLLSAAGERTLLSSEQIRHLGAAAIHQANQVNFLLGQLSALLDEPDGGPDG